jgi:tetratricopeptide (TPR) repeat protein
MTTINTYLKGQQAFLGGDLEDCIIAFSDALEHGIHPMHSYLNRGIAYFKTALFDRAVEDFNRVIKEDKNHERALFYRGIAKLNLEENKEAIHDLDRAISLKPDKGASYLARGLAHHSLGHIKEAKKDIHDGHVLKNIELGEFMEENILSETLFNRTLKLFENDEAKWELSLTDSEVERMDVVH